MELTEVSSATWNTSPRSRPMRTIATNWMDILFPNPVPGPSAHFWISFDERLMTGFENMWEALTDHGWN